MTTIRTASGIQMDLAGPIKPHHLHWQDIVVGLSHQPRFNGQTPVFLSVAQHSVQVALRLRQKKCSPEIQWEGLLHDAEEAYPPGDLVYPIKYLPECEGILCLQKKIRLAIAQEFGLPSSKTSEVHEADQAQLREEQTCLVEISAGLRGSSWAWSPAHARFMFELMAVRILSEMPSYATLSSKISPYIDEAVWRLEKALMFRTSTGPALPTLDVVDDRPFEEVLAEDIRAVFVKHNLDPDTPRFSQFINALEMISESPPSGRDSE